ncbi:TPA: PLP-dependent transferase [Streptococcus pneumoniae]|nr:PLP-dependent transferase [Streptococcus pneumoniae]
MRKPGNIYTRITNPTTAALEGGVEALATASGMTAVTYTILALAHAGEHVVAASTTYGGTFNLLKEPLPRYGITTTFVDVDNLEEVEAAGVTPNQIHLSIGLENVEDLIEDLRLALEKI